MILNKTKFAEYANVSREAIYKAIKSGTVIVRKDGKLDTNNKVNKAYIKKNNGANPKVKKKIEAERATAKTTSKKNTVKKTTPKKPPRKPPTPKVKPRPEDDPDYDPDEGITTLPEILGKPLKDLNIHEANLLRVIEQIRKDQVKTNKDLQELVDRKLVRTAIGRLFTIHQNEFLTIGDNIGAEVAGMLGFSDNETILKVGKLIQDKCYQVLKHIKRDMLDFLLKIKAEPLDEHPGDNK